MSPAEAAAEILAAVGGRENVASVTHCYSRLRFTLRDTTLAEDARLGALPGVAIVIRQGGQLHVALSSGLVVTYDALVGLIAT